MNQSFSTMSIFNNPNETYKDFKLKKVVPLKELKCRLIEVVHTPTNAAILHIENDDPENLFCLSFQTLPSSSNGVAHILEHTVLCGSKKFPIKDPFFSMTRRSLNTFMNALTGADFTCYPAATQIKKDFYNLLDVYIDAVFHPILDRRSFEQEGIRIEYEKFDDPTTPLTFRGIVFNEMKGAMHSGQARMHELLYKSLYPSLTYGVNSGGDPKQIRTLTYEELLLFHKTYYHPSRCLFFFYGNFPLKDHLDYIEKAILEKTEKAPPLPPMRKETRYVAPKVTKGFYPIPKGESKENKTLISFGFLTTEATNQLECLALGVIEIVLLDTDASILKRAFLDSKLCKQVSCYLDAEIKEVPFTIHFKGCEEENLEALVEVMQTTLKKVVAEGIEKEAIDIALHQFEFHGSEITGDHAPFGLTLFMRSGLLYQHGGKPESGLLIHSLFDELREKMKENPDYLLGLIQKYLIDNPHFVQAILKPDEDLENTELNEEQTTLEKIREILTEKEQETFISKAKELKTFQKMQEEEDIDLLPKVTIDDVPKKGRDLLLVERQHQTFNVFQHACFTNEIGYVDLFFPFPTLSKEELINLRLLTVLLPQLGTKKKGYEETLKVIQASTGGILPYLTLGIKAKNPLEFSPAFAIRGKALYRNLGKLFPLLSDLIYTAEFNDKNRLKELLQKHWISLEQSVNQGALKYAINLSCSPLSQANQLANLFFGLEYYNAIKKSVANLDENLDALIASLKGIQEKLFFKNTFDMVLSMDDVALKRLEKENYFNLCTTEKPKGSSFEINDPLQEIVEQGRVIASPVAFIAKVFNTVPYTHQNAPYLSLAACLLDNLSLHKKIREEGGAYGGGAVSNALSGNFYFFSYRDPHIASTLDAFSDAIQLISEGKFDDQDLESAKLEIIQDLDQPISPGSRADVAYNWMKEGRTATLRQNFRDGLLNATKDDVIVAVREHIAKDFEKGKEVVFAGAPLLEKENKLLQKQGKKPLTILSI